MVIGISLVLVFSTLSFVLQIENQNNAYQETTEPLILKLGNDLAINSAVNILTKNVVNSLVINIDSLRELQSYIENSHSSVFIVGHGSPVGLLVNRKVVSWNIINSIEFKGKHEYFIACDSANGLITNSNKITAFSGVVDSRVASLSSAAINDFYNGETKSAESLLKSAVSYQKDIANGVRSILPLDIFSDIVNSVPVPSGMSLWISTSWWYPWVQLHADFSSTSVSPKIESVMDIFGGNTIKINGNTVTSPSGFAPMATHDPAYCGSNIYCDVSNFFWDNYANIALLTLTGVAVGGALATSYDPSLVTITFLTFFTSLAVTTTAMDGYNLLFVGILVFGLSDLLMLSGLVSSTNPIMTALSALSLAFSVDPLGRIVFTIETIAVIATAILMILSGHATTPE